MNAVKRIVTQVTERAQLLFTAIRTTPGAKAMKRLPGPASDEAPPPFPYLMVILILAGLVLIVLSALIEASVSPATYGSRLSADILKELGIVVSTVCTVSLLYERLVGQRYMAAFLKAHRDQLKQIEGNAGACARFGIRAIFDTRDLLEDEHPLRGWIQQLGPRSTCRVVAITLAQLTLDAPHFRDAIKRGAKLEFCFTDPTYADTMTVAENLSRMIPDEIRTVVKTLQQDILASVIADQAIGSVEVRLHRLPLFDSYLSLKSPTLNLAVWDLSFGRAKADKRVFYLEGV